jgi:hypothetical protein
MATLALWEDCGKSEIPLTFSLSILQRQKFKNRAQNLRVPLG